MTKRRFTLSLLISLGAALAAAPYIPAVTLKLAPYLNGGAGGEVKEMPQRAANQPMSHRGEILDERAAFEQDSKRLDALGADRKLPEVLKVIEEIKHRWGARPGPHYGLLMAGACSTLNSVDFNDPRQYELAYRNAAEVLEQPHRLPEEPARRLEVETRLVLCLNRDLGDPSWEVVPGWEVRRRLNAEKFLSVWQGIQSGIDPAFDFENLPSLNVSPPAGAGVTAGAHPSAVKDPAKRAEYEAAIEANRRKAEAYTLQRSLKTTAEVFRPHLKGYLVAAYSTATAKVEELESLLSQYSVDAALKAEILGEIVQADWP